MATELIAHGSETALVDAGRADGGHDVPVADELVEDELLVEEISIDGMCGVY